MIRGLGRAIWTQSREIRVINYPQFMLYEIYTNHGFLNIAHNKTTNTVQIVNGIPECYTSSSQSNFSKDEAKKILLPDLE